MLSDYILSTKSFFVRFVNGFEDSTRTTQAENLPNHIAWSLGHCALTMNRAAERFDGKPLPETDFIMGDGANGDSSHFDTESVCFDSTPQADPENYPTLERATVIFEAACDRFAQAVRNTTDTKLDEMIDFHGNEVPLYTLIMRLCFHNGAHAGQIIDLRRSLSMPRVIR
jgi:hypothetical protein